jgi:hypothetical protein
MPNLVAHGRAPVFASDAGKFKEAFEKIQKNDFTGLEPIKQDAEDAEKVGTSKHIQACACMPIPNTSTSPQHSPPSLCMLCTIRPPCPIRCPVETLLAVTAAVKGSISISVTPPSRVDRVPQDFG